MCTLYDKNLFSWKLISYLKLQKKTKKEKKRKLKTIKNSIQSIQSKLRNAEHLKNETNRKTFLYLLFQ